MLNIYFIRHCQTDYTPEGLLRDEKHLCQAGRQQAIELKKQLQKSKIHFDAIYTSDMVRGVETITPYVLDEHKKIISRQTLRELKIHWELKVLFEESKKNPHFKFPDGESLQQGRSRYLKATQKIIDKHSSGNIIIVTHGVVFREFLKHHFPADPIDQLVISNPDVYKVQIKNNKVISYDKEESLVPENAIVRHHS